MKQLIFRKRVFLIATIFLFLFLFSACHRSLPPEQPDNNSEQPDLSADGSDNAVQSVVTIAQVQPGVLYEDDMVKISVDGMEMVEGYPEILCTFENKSDLQLRFSKDNIIVNGIVLPIDIYTSPAPHSTEQARMTFTGYEMEKVKITHISSIEIDMTLVNHVTWEDLYTLPRMIVPMKDDPGAPVQEEGQVLADNEETRITLIEATQQEETVECRLLVENKGLEKFMVSTTGFIINGIEVPDSAYYADVPSGCKAPLNISILTSVLSDFYGIDTLKEMSVSVNLFSDSRGEYMYIDDMKVFP